MPVARLADLLGVRSSKGRFYREYRHGARSLERTVSAVTAVSALLADATADPEDMIDQTLPVLARLLDATAVVLVASHPGLGTDPVCRSAGLDEAGLAGGGLPGGAPVDSATVDGSPVDGGHAHATVVDEIVRIAAEVVPLTGDSGPARGRIVPAPAIDADVLVTPLPRRADTRGFVAAAVPLFHHADSSDLAILATLTNQLAGAIVSGYRLRLSEALRAEANTALRAADEHARELQRRNSSLREARHELLRARESQILAEERQRIARDLHDSVAQHVLTIGMQVEWCRITAAQPELVDRLTETKDLARTTVAEIRQAIFALNRADEVRRDGLLPAVRRLARELALRELAIRVVAAGDPVRLDLPTERALLMVVKEALFNVVIHAEASRATVRLAFDPDAVRLTVTDNGTGRGVELRRRLEWARQHCDDGYHRGLANIEDRVRQIGGELGLTDAPGGGVRLRVVVPTARREYS